MKGVAVITRSATMIMLLATSLTVASCGQRQNREVTVAKAGETELTIGSAAPIAGTGLLSATVSTRRSDRSLGSGSLDYSTDISRNIIIIDPATGANRRLLPGNARAILDMLWLPDTVATANVVRRDESFDAPVSLYVLAVRQGGESRLIDIMVGRVAEGQAKPAVVGAQELYAATALGDGRVALLLAMGGRAYHVLISIDDAKIVSETPVTIQ